VNTKSIDDDVAAEVAVADVAETLDVPTADPVRDGADRIVDGIVDAGLGE
jgi:uncharacterized NAD-dependent epimerase/dehydratase family protein